MKICEAVSLTLASRRRTRGTQFTLAVLVALVPDSYIAPDPDAGVARLAGTLMGIALLEPVLAAFHVFTWGRADAAKDNTS